MRHRAGDGVIDRAANKSNHRYSATQVPLTPVRMQPAGSSPRDARKVEAGVSQTSVSSFQAIIASVRGWVRSAMGQLGRIKPIYAIVAGAGVLLLLGAFLLFRSSPAPRPAATVSPSLWLHHYRSRRHLRWLRGTHRSQDSANRAQIRPTKAAEVGGPLRRLAPHKPKPFTDGESQKPATITPRRKAKKKLYEEL